MDRTDKPPIRVYVAEPLTAGATLDLDENQAHYLGSVMRLKAGHSVALFNGRDGEWSAEILQLGRKRVTVRVTVRVTRRIRQQDADHDLWLAFAPVKKARIDSIVEKATELGVRRLIPVFTHHTNVGRVNTARLAANAREAAEQCGRLSVPEIADAIDLDSLLTAWPDERALMFCDEAGQAEPVLDALSPYRDAPRPWGVLIGPEGGFSQGERERIRNQATTLAVSLGPRILRADTACAAALTLWQSALGDLA